MDDLIIVTATFFKPGANAYDDEVALPLAVATVREAVKNDLPIIVVDGSPDPEAARALKRAGAEVIFQETAGFGPAVRQAVATGARVIRSDGSVHWQEPMKNDLVRFHRCFADEAARENAAIFVPERQKSSWETYPAEQALQEQFTNLYAAVISGGRLNFDFTFGPKVFRRPGIELVAKCNGRIWDAHIVPVVQAVKTGRRVSSAAIPYCHPRIQRLAEEGKPEWIKKRREQLIHVTSTLEEAWNAA